MVLANSGQVFSLAGQHLVLAVLPMIFGLLISIPLAQLARQNRTLRTVVLTASSLLYTIPSLALSSSCRPCWEPGFWTRPTSSLP